MSKLGLGLTRTKDGRIVRPDGEGGTKVVKPGGGFPDRFSPGRYVARVLNVSVRSSTKKRGVVHFALDTEVVAVLDQTPFAPNSKAKSRAVTMVGRKAGVVYSSASLGYADDVTRTCLAVLGYTVDDLPPDETDPEGLCDEVTIDLDVAANKQAVSPAAGTLVLINSWEGTERDSGEPSGFINTRVMPLPADLEAQYASVH